MEYALGALFLNGKLALHDVKDIEGLSIRIAAKQRLQGEEFEDLVAYLVSTAWELSERYERGDGGLRFGSYAYRILSQ